MNQNFQKTLTQNNNSPEFPLFSKIQQNSNLIPNPHYSPINRVSILKTEEQKEIVRTNVYNPNDSSGIKKEFSVVTEIIRRNSNISFNSKNDNTYNKLPLNFSFNQQISEPSLNQTFQNPNLNIEINDYDKNKSKNNSKNDSYKSLIKRIASQLTAQIRPPSQGFFYFSMLKGQYPLMIIKKMEKEIINHIIDLDSEIFAKYSEKYLKYMELVKKIAHLLKVNMKNKMFWENERYNQKNNNNIINQNNPEREINKSSKVNANQNVQNIILKNASKAKNTKNNLQNKTAQNIQSTLTFQNKNNNINNTYYNQPKNIFCTMNQKKSNFLFHTGKEFSTNNINNNTDIQNKNQNNIGSQRINTVINPFKISKNQNQNNINFDQKNEFLINPFKKPINSKTEVNNHFDMINGNTQIIALSKAKINKEIANVNEQSKVKDDDIEMKDTLNINNFTDETNVYNDFVEDKNIVANKDSKILINTNIIPEQNNMISNTKQKINSFNTNNTQTNYFQNNPSIIRTNKVQKIILSSKKGDKKNLEIKLSALKKSDEKKIDTQIKLKIPSKETKIDFNEINIPNINSNITNEHITFVNKFNIFLANSGIVIESNIPLSNEEQGQQFLKMDEFWQKYVNYVYINYLINKNKISLFNFVRLVEEYFIWCENNDADSAKKFKNLIIDIINKVFEEKEIEKFLKMNKLNKLEDIFARYEVFLKYGNESKSKRKKEFEIKIDNEQDCNCEICKNEKACLLKMSEINKKINTNVNVESILINAEYLPKAKNNNKLKLNNLQMAFKGKDKKCGFSKTKTEKSFESEYQYLPNFSNKGNKFSNNIIESLKKEENENKIKEEEKEQKKENFIEITNNYKLEDFFSLESEKNIQKKSKSKGKEKSKDKENNSKKEIHKSQEEKIEKEKSKKNNKKKSKPSKNNAKRKYNYPDSESDSEDEKNKSKDKSKRSYQYPKTKKTKGKK